MSEGNAERHTISDDEPTIITVGSIERGKHWLSNARSIPFYGMSPAMQAIADLKAFNELPPDVRAQAIASMPDIWDED